MKLSHRDFRPQRRSKYVSQPPTRRPTLRIILLAAFGAVVYLKFDSFVSSRVFQVLRNPQLLRQALARPGRLADPTPANLPLAAASSLKWSADSNEADLDCASQGIDPCVNAGQALGPEALGSLRSLINKAAIRWEVVATKGLHARFRKSGPTREDSLGWRIQTLELASDKDVTLISATENGGLIRFCSAGRCLDESTPEPPFAKYQGLDGAERPPQWVIQPVGSPIFHPVLPGKIVEILSQSKSVKIYHGRNIFSVYAGFSELRPDLHPGSMVNMNDTLGSVEHDGESLGSLKLRIEKDGLFINPIAFLGVMPDTGAAAHGR